MRPSSPDFRNLSGIVVVSMLGAMNDNLIKAALIVLAAMTLPAAEAASVGLIAGGLLMAPFLMFSGWAGTLADKFEKARMIRIMKWAELALSGIGCLAMISGNVPFLLGLVFLMGTHSAFYGPLKLGWLPERLGKDRLVAANGWLETLTFIGILAGTVTGSLLGAPDSIALAGASSICIAAIGVLCAHLLPSGAAVMPDAYLPRNPLSSGAAAIAAVFSDPVSKRAALLASWFWAAGSVYLSTLPAQMQTILGAGDKISAIVMALFAIGIAIGSVIAARILKGKTGTRTVFPGIIVITIASAMIPSIIGFLPDQGGVSGLLGTVPGAILIAALLTIALGGGLFEIPLKAMIQARCGHGMEARTMAGYNLLSSIGIVVVAIAVSGALALGVAPVAAYVAVAMSAGLTALLTFGAFAADALKWVGNLVLHSFFRLEIEGAEHLEQEGPAVFISNHVSFLDGPMLFSLLPGTPSIAVYSGWMKTVAMRLLARTIRAAAIDPTSPMSAKTLAKSIRAGEQVLIFPEGRISLTGALMRVYPGTAWLVDMANAPVVPIHIEGAEGSFFSRPIPGLRRRLFPKLRVRVGAPVRLDISPDLRGRDRRAAATRALRDVMENLRCEALRRVQTLPDLLHEAGGKFTSDTPAILDPLGTSLSYGQLARAMAACSAQLGRRAHPGERIGILLPGVAGALVILGGLWRAGLVPAILNPTLGAAPLLSAIRTGRVQTLISSRAFVEKAKLQSVIDAVNAAGIAVIWTEDLRRSMGIADKISALWLARRPSNLPIKTEDPAVILFTSGTEGEPKGVVLTHGGLVANISQLRARTDVSSRDRVLNAMPLFHSFGLTAGLLLPVATGARVMIYPSPLHYRVIPQLAYDHQATLIFGTDTFLTGWAKRADPVDFVTLRAAIAGAEAVREPTRRLWAEKFGVRILEGYGATEAGPVIALNTPDANLAGTVGRLLPGISAQMQPIEGVEGGRLRINGPNLMAGYLLPGQDPERPENLVPPDAGWYDTGDIVIRDARGFLRISGRAKRFAKIAGEMVSLAACEALAGRVWPEDTLAAISIPDARKGERVILVTTRDQAQRSDLLAAARDAGISEVQVPSEIRIIDKLPLLATGKVDYPELMRRMRA